MTAKTLSRPQTTSKPKITNFRFLMNATDSECVPRPRTGACGSKRLHVVSSSSAAVATPTVTVASLKVGGVTCQLSGYVC